jgi:3-hydroxyacyl-CoA dehydrogenase
MDLDQKLTLVSVVGAAGKMGSGITLLLAQEMARLSMLPEHQDKVFRLNAIDLDPAALRGLQEYVHAQALKASEKSAVALRDLYSGREALIENAEIIHDFTRRVGEVIWPTTDIGAARGSELVFEAIVEKPEVKIDVFEQLKKSCAEDAVFLTNTSSVPIHLLDEQAGLDGRIIGFHFYNPPPVQKLVEVIEAKGTRKDVAQLAQDLGKRLRKKLFPAADVAGFIGNGHFIRDGNHGLSEAEKLASEHGWPAAIYSINRVSQDWLVRPMGIFQLIDYVGVDVFKMIQDVMDSHLDEKLTHSVIDRMVDLGVLGGQRGDGSQKPGFLEYQKGRPAAIYDLEKKDYVPLDPEGWTKQADERLGALPDGFRPWKALLRAPDKSQALDAHFEQLAGMSTTGAELAKAHLERSRQIGQKLVDDGVAASADDVNGVLMSGFYHLYGPINDYCK